MASPGPTIRLLGGNNLGLFDSLSGLDGKIEIVGLGAVVALLQRWNLERRSDEGSAEATWNLSAFMSYQNDALIAKSTAKRRLTLNMGKDYSGNQKVILAESTEGSTWKVEGNSLTIEGVRAWQK